MKKIKLSWPVKITVAAFFLSVIIGVFTNTFVEKVNIFAAFFILLLVILIGIVFDIIGVSVTVADETPFHSRLTRGYSENREAIKLIRNASKVSNFCNDVIGDIAGVISGGLSAAIAANIINAYKNLNAVAVSLLLTAVVAAATVGGKAAGKNVSMKHSEKIVLKVSIIISLFKKIFSFNKRKK